MGDGVMNGEEMGVGREVMGDGVMNGEEMGVAWKEMGNGDLNGEEWGSEKEIIMKGNGKRMKKNEKLNKKR